MTEQEYWMAELNFITEHRQKLRKSEVKVADYVESHANEVIHNTISELADCAGISEPTVIRFCRALGFRGFQDFKIFLAQSIIPSVQNIHESVSGNEEASELIQKVFDANIHAINNSLKTLDFSEVKNVINLMINSTRVIFFGLGGSGVVAMDAYHKMFRININCEWFCDPHMAIIAASMMKPGDIFFAISHSGSTVDVVKALEVAGGCGAETVAIVSHAKSPVSQIADHTLCVVANETMFKMEPMSSRIAHLSIIDAIAVGLSLHFEDDTVTNLNKSRKALVDKRY